MILQRINNQKGFRLIDLTIVIAIIAILLAIAVPNFITYRNNQKANNEPLQITTQEEKIVDEKTPRPPKQKGDLNKL